MTHTTKHTPGPWGVDGAGQVCKRAENGSWDLIAYLDESPYYHNKFANAHLIAAAPAMYEALRQAYAYLTEMGCDCEEGQSCGDCIVCQCETALAQADGKP